MNDAEAVKSLIDGGCPQCGGALRRVTKEFVFGNYRGTAQPLTVPDVAQLECVKCGGIMFTPDEAGDALRRALAIWRANE